MEQMFEISEKIFRLLTRHLKEDNCVNENCCIKKLLKLLELE